MVYACGSEWRADGLARRGAGGGTASDAANRPNQSWEKITGATVAAGDACAVRGSPSEEPPLWEEGGEGRSFIEAAAAERSSSSADGPQHARIRRDVGLERRGRRIVCVCVCK